MPRPSPSAGPSPRTTSWPASSGSADAPSACRSIVNRNFRDGTLGTQQIATRDNVPRLSLLEVYNVGHAWPAGTGTPNHTQGGFWIAQDSLNYPEYVAD